MRHLPLILLALLLAACGPSGGPGPAAAPAPTVPAVREILGRPAPGPLTTFGYLYLTADGAALVDGLHVGPAGEPAPVDAAALWLEPAPELPDDTALAEAGDARYGIVMASGTLEGPGSYGPRGAYSYRLAAPQVELLSVRELSIPLLLSNAALYEGQPVRLQGELLTNGVDALLIERIGPGGVPDETALQLKLAIPPPDPALDAALSTAGSGRVRFGPVEVTGLWRGGRLYPLVVTAR